MAGGADARQDPAADLLPVVQPVVPPAAVAHPGKGAAASTWDRLSSLWSAGFIAFPGLMSCPVLAKMLLWVSQVISESGASLGTSKDEERDQLRREVSCAVDCCFGLVCLSWLAGRQKMWIW